MAAPVLRQHLPNFGGPAAGAEIRDFRRPGAPPESMKPLYEPKPKVEAAATPARPREQAPDPAAVLAAAVAAARAEALAEAQQAFEAEKARDAEAFEAHLDLARQQWAAETALALSEAHTRAMAEMEERLANAAGRVLLPFLSEAVRARAIDELTGHITRLLATPGTPVLQISGPEDLLAALRARCGEAGIAYAPGAGADIRLVADDTIIETQLSAWSAHLNDALA
ncbi:hypothetical protein ACLBXM_18780 [Xanthobacteraceae bacterium A53D]